MEHWNFGNAYVFCKGNVDATEQIIYLPWYMIIYYKAEEIPKNMKYEIDLSGQI